MVSERDKFKAEYEKIVVEYNKKLFIYAKSLCKNRDHAEEITQEALLTGYKYFGSLADRQKAFPWLKTIAKRIYLRRFCKNIYDDSVISLDSPAYEDSDLYIADTIADGGVDVAGDYERGELLERILDEIKTLSPKQRDAVIFRHFYGYSVKETAASLNMTDNSVKVSSHIGLDKIKKN